MMATDFKARVAHDALLRELVALVETSWFNPVATTVAAALPDVGLAAADLAQAEQRLLRFAPYLQRAFPETADSGGIIESPLQRAAQLQEALSRHYGMPLTGQLWLKLDSQLPISGSIKARGGIHEVLKEAERRALEGDLFKPGQDYAQLDSDEARAFFSRYALAVGSTGNLGLSIGIMGAKVGFRTRVHMSADARQWKKDKLREQGVDVVEYAGDYGAAVEEGRRQAASDPLCHFIDDENSTQLFLGYAVAGARLQAQFARQGIKVDEDHPLFVYLPCGVGGGPGGVAFGLKLAFGDHVHCLFAEPTHSPCMLLGVYTGLHDKISVHDIGIDNETAADGLAVARPSGFVGRAMQRLIDGYYTVSDEELFRLLALAHHAEGTAMEPSAAAGLAGIARVQSTGAAMQGAQAFRDRFSLDDGRMAGATHLAWITGGSMVPSAEMQAYLARGYALLDT